MIVKNNKQLVTVYKGVNSISAIYKGITHIWSGIKYKTITGNPAIFSDGADNKPIKSLKASIVPVQSGSGDPSPSNIRPISGWTGAQINANGTTIPVSWQSSAGTVYGGVVDVISGELVVDRAMVDLGSLNWVADPNRPGVFYTSSLVSLARGSGKIIADIYKCITVGVPSASDLKSEDNSISLYPSYGVGCVYTIDTSKATLTGNEYKTVMNGVRCAYELATPLTYQLTPQEVRTLLGNNVIGADCGPVEVTYPYESFWKIVQKNVRAGKAAQLYPIRSQLSVTKGNQTLVWDVIGIDNDQPADPNYTHSLTLQLHDVYTNLQFDPREALFYCEEGLAAGTYNFTVKQHSWVSGDVNKTFQFTLTQAIPAKGQLVLDVAYNVTIANSTAKTYSGAASATAIETVTITEGSGGTSLGDVNNAISGGTNSLQRALLGNIRYSQSALRQYLNSNAAAGSVWTPKNVWDRAPSWATTTAGFLNGMDEDFLSVIGEVTKRTALNTVSDGGGYEDTIEKFFLLSRSEVYGGNEVTGGEGAAYPYYSDYSDLGSAGTVNDSNRIKYRNGSAQYWWLRSPYAGYAYYMRSVYPTGIINYGIAYGSSGVAPACVIY